MKASQRRAVRVYLIYRRCPSCNRMGSLTYSVRDDQCGCSNCSAAYRVSWSFTTRGPQGRTTVERALLEPVA